MKIHLIISKLALLCCMHGNVNGQEVKNGFAGWASSQHRVGRIQTVSPIISIKTNQITTCLRRCQKTESCSAIQYKVGY